MSRDGLYAENAGAIFSLHDDLDRLTGSKRAR
jgi:hypothetical protein